MIEVVGKKIEKVSIDQVIEAEWNYKVEGAESDIKKLANSILKRGSAGVLAVREVEIDGDIKFETCDGNHRLRALRDELGVKFVYIENFGKISMDEAVLLTRSRNHNWFEDDKLKLANLMTEHVLSTHEINDLIDSLPESAQELEAYQNIANFEWQEPEKNESEGTGGDSNGSSYADQKTDIKLSVSEEVYNLWEKWLERCENITGLSNKERAFEFAVIEALNVPEEDLEGRSNEQDTDL